jgi:hypothetical protein
MKRSTFALPQVRFALAPSGGETILSYAFRVGAHNLHARPLELLSTLRSGRQIKGLWELDPEVLSRIYRQPVEAFIPLVATPVGGEAVAIGGRIIAAHELLRSSRRVSPTGLRNSDTDQCDWAIRPLTFCPTNWDVLLDTCPNKECGLKLNWTTRSIFHCGSCGHDLRRARTAKIRLCDRDIARILPDLLSRDVVIVDRAKAPFPADLANLSANDLMDVVHVIGRGALAVSAGTARRASAGYPHAWIAGVTSLRDPDFIPSIMTGRHKPALYHPFTAEVRRWLDGLSPAGAETLRNFLDPEHHLAPTRSGKFLSVTTAAARLRIERSAVRSLIQLGHLEVFSAGCAAKQRQHDLITADSVEILANDRASISSISAEYKIPKSVLLDLVGMGVLEALDHAAFPAIYSELQLKSLHARTLLSQMLAKVQNRSKVGSAGLRIAAKPLLDRLGGGDHLWANLLWSDLNDKLQHGLSTTCRSSLRLDALLLHPTDAEAIARGAVDLSPSALSRSTAIRLKDAEAMLSMNPRDMQVLIREGALTRCGTGVSDASVRDAAEKFISTREIGKLINGDSYDVSMLAAARGLPRLWPRVGVWDRAAALAAFADLVEACALERAA